MSGRRRTGAFADTVSTLVLQDRERRFKEEDDRRDFDRRLQEAGIKAGIETGQISPQFEGGQFRGFRQGAPSPLLAPQLTGGPALAPGGQGGANDLPEGTTITQTIKTPQGTITIKRGGSKSVKPPSEAEASRLMLGAQAGQPLSVAPQPVQIGTHPTTLEPITRQGGGLPSSPGGQRFAQQLLSGGQLESPASQFLGNRLAPHTFPQGQFVEGPGGTFLGGRSVEAAPGYTVPRSQVLDLVRSGTGMVERPTTQLAPSVASPDLPPPAEFQEGDVIEDDQTGRRFRLARGQWVPL